MIYKQFNKPIKIIGFSITTSNDNGQAFTDIPKHWNKVMGNNLLATIPNIAGDNLYGIYTDFEHNGVSNNGKYLFVIGLPVSSHDTVPGEMVAVTIPEGMYRQFDVQKGHPEKVGDNGSGKSTLFKALLRDASVAISGMWRISPTIKIGYLDQHYDHLLPNATVLSTLEDVVEGWSTHALRRHLNAFLFSTNEQVNAQVTQLSGGEKVRLSLACIAAQSPELLLLDEVTNNVDMQTREHIIQVLAQYPGALIVISHDTDFVERIDIATSYEVKGGTVVLSV